MSNASSGKPLSAALPHYRAGRYDAAAEVCRQVLTADPSNWYAWYLLGAVLAKLEHLQDAEVAYRAAIELRPADSRPRFGLGAVLSRVRRLDEAQRLFEECLVLRGPDAKVYAHLGGCLNGQALYAQALELYDKAIALAPDDPDHHYYAAMVRLAMGDFDGGWPEFKWRLETTRFADRRYTNPRWDGAPLDGRPILVYSEGGLGDTLQFVRYVPRVEARGGHVFLEVPPRMVPLLHRSGFQQAIARGTRGWPRDMLQVSVVSLPRIFEASLANIPSTVPYLSAHPETVAAWRERLLPHAGFRVGIHWEGSPNAPMERRSIPLQKFEALARLPGVTLISLAQGGIPDRSTASPFVVELGPLDTHAAFVDTAAIMKNLDLVITCDTSIAHLAGGLGVPVWVALMFVPDWRWMIGRSDSPWYPTMRLFRQSRLDDWDSVFSEIAAELDRTAHAATSRK